MPTANSTQHTSGLVIGSRAAELHPVTRPTLRILLWVWVCRGAVGVCGLWWPFQSKLPLRLCSFSVEFCSGPLFVLSCLLALYTAVTKVVQQVTQLY